MKTPSLLLAVGLTILTTTSTQAAIGYVNRQFVAGDNLFCNPLLGTNNALSVLIPSAPQDTTVSLWNPATSAFDTPSVFTGGAWSTDFNLPPGPGARLTTVSAFVNTFFGLPLNHDGTLFNGELPLIPAPVFSGPDGLYLLGDKEPVAAATGTEMFFNVMGRVPNLGEQITTLDEASQTYTTSTYLGSGNWDVVPVWSISDAAFFRVAAVPEPGTAMLSIIGLGFLVFWRHRAKPDTARN